MISPRLPAVAAALALPLAAANAQERADWRAGYPDGCTTITVGRKASADGSVMTSHTCDSHRTGSAIVVEPARKHETGSEILLLTSWAIRRASSTR